LAGGLKVSRQAMSARTPDEIRRSIEQNRNELAVSLTQLRGEVAELTDWRAHVNRHRRELMIGAAVVGFAVGLRGLRRRRKR
jgi:hypothetical protein